MKNLIIKVIIILIWAWLIIWLMVGNNYLFMFIFLILGILWVNFEDVILPDTLNQDKDKRA